MRSRDDTTAKYALEAAIRLVTDSGYFVLRAPNWPSVLEVAIEQRAVQRQPAATVSLRTESAPRVQLLTLKEFCRAFSISRSAAYLEIAAGRLKIRKIGRSTRISESAALEWLEARNRDSMP